MRSYTNRAVHIEEPSEQEKNRLFAEMKKDTYEEQHRDCESCGYSSCTNMVRAIHNGVNIKENCVHYVRGMAEEEAKRLQKSVIRNGMHRKSDSRRLLRSQNGLLP